MGIGGQLGHGAFAVAISVRDAVGDHRGQVRHAVPVPVVSDLVGHKDDHVRVGIGHDLERTVGVLSVAAGVEATVLDLPGFTIGVEPDTDIVPAVLVERGTVELGYLPEVVAHGAGVIDQQADLVACFDVLEHDVVDGLGRFAGRDDERPAGHERVPIRPVVPVVAEGAAAAGAVAVPGGLLAADLLVLGLECVVCQEDILPAHVFVLRRDLVQVVALLHDVRALGLLVPGRAHLDVGELIITRAGDDEHHEGGEKAEYDHDAGALELLATGVVVRGALVEAKVSGKHCGPPWVSFGGGVQDGQVRRMKELRNRCLYTSFWVLSTPLG